MVIEPLMALSTLIFFCMALVAPARPPPAPAPPFGDVSGDGVVDANDVGQLKGLFNRNSSDPLYLWYVDADNSGSIDAGDVGQFKLRFNANVF